MRFYIAPSPPLATTKGYTRIRYVLMQNIANIHSIHGAIVRKTWDAPLTAQVPTLKIKNAHINTPLFVSAPVIDPPTYSSAAFPLSKNKAEAFSRQIASPLSPSHPARLRPDSEENSENLSESLYRAAQITKALPATSRNATR